jgi:hypothetical protein
MAGYQFSLQPPLLLILIFNFSTFINFINADDFDLGISLTLSRHMAVNRHIYRSLTFASLSEK